MSITLLQVIAAARSGQVSLVGEMVGYLVLGVADQVVGLPRRVDPGRVEVGAEGALRVAAGQPVAGADCEADLRHLMSHLLDCSRTTTPALTKCGRRVARGDIACLVRELEAALIPVNRSAGRRVLARLFRETQRAVETGGLALIARPGPVIEADGIQEACDGPALPEDPAVEMVGIAEECGALPPPAERASALEGLVVAHDAIEDSASDSAAVLFPVDQTVALEVLSPRIPPQVLILEGDDLTDRVPEAWTPTAFWMEPEAPPQERTAPLPLSAEPPARVAEHSVHDFEIEVDVDVAIDDPWQVSPACSTPRPEAPGEASRASATPLLHVAVHDAQQPVRPRVLETTPVLSSVVVRPAVSELAQGIPPGPEAVHKETDVPVGCRMPNSGSALAPEALVFSEPDSLEPEAQQVSCVPREHATDSWSRQGSDSEDRSGDGGHQGTDAGVPVVEIGGSFECPPPFVCISDPPGESPAAVAGEDPLPPLPDATLPSPFDDPAASSEAKGIVEAFVASAVEAPFSPVVDMAGSEPTVASSAHESLSPPAIEPVSPRTLAGAEAETAAVANHAADSPSLPVADELRSRNDEPDGCEPLAARAPSFEQGDGHSGAAAGGDPPCVPAERGVDVDSARRRVEAEVLEAQLAQAELRRQEIAPEREEPVEWIPASPPVETRTPAPVGDVNEPWDEQPVPSGEFRAKGPEPPKRAPTRLGSAPPVFSPRCSDVDELLRQFASGQSDDEIRSSLVEFAEEFSSSVPIAGVRSRRSGPTSGVLVATDHRPGAPTTEQGPPRGR